MYIVSNKLQELQHRIEYLRRNLSWYVMVLLQQEILFVHC